MFRLVANVGETWRYFGDNGWTLLPTIHNKVYIFVDVYTESGKFRYLWYGKFFGTAKPWKTEEAVSKLVEPLLKDYKVERVDFVSARYYDHYWQKPVRQFVTQVITTLPYILKQVDIWNGYTEDDYRVLREDKLRRFFFYNYVPYDIHNQFYGFITKTSGRARREAQERTRGS